MRETIADAGVGGACRATFKKVGEDGFQHKERDTSTHHYKRGIGEGKNKLVCSFGAVR